MTLAKFVFIAALAICVIVISLSGFADEKNAPNAANATSKVAIREKPSFELIDANSDGLITEEEAKDSWLATIFSKVDTNQDGLIDRSEYEHA